MLWDIKKKEGEKRVRRSDQLTIGMSEESVFLKQYGFIRRCHSITLNKNKIYLEVMSLQKQKKRPKDVKEIFFFD